ncbi:MAG: FAD-dependent oxidoreductase [Oligoflexia bacterium]|nr:FAD-dependent oxidoreductase [Oligoflexia bacterium]
MKVAVIGAGMAGLTAAHYLSRKHDVTVFERQNRIGGNAYTLKTRDGQFLDIAVAAFGQAGYTNFYKLLDELGVETDFCANSYMSFHDLDNGKGIYIPGALKGLLAQRLDILRPKRLLSFVNMFRGLNQWQKMYDQGKTKGLTLYQAFEANACFDQDSRLFMICTFCLLSSMSASEVLSTPVEFFIEKLRIHHDVVSPKAVYSVRCIKLGTKAYINALAAPIRDKIKLESKLTMVKRHDKGVDIGVAGKDLERFDSVVFACPPDQILEIFRNPIQSEEEFLKKWRFKNGRVVVHRDHKHFPRRDLIQAYTFLYRRNSKHSPIEAFVSDVETSVNGALWHEPQAPKDSDFISTQHPNFEIDPQLIEFETILSTPIYDFNSFSALKSYKAMLSQPDVHFCGSYLGYGLHEDAVRTALDVAEQLGCAPSWFEPRDLF